MLLIRARRWFCSVLLLISWLPIAAHAAGFKIINASTQLQGGIYLLNAKIQYRLSEATRDALQNGVPLTVVLDMEVRRQRSWAWDETVYALAQRFRLEYHSLSKQYLVTNLNSGERRAFPELEDALQYMGQIKNFPFLDRGLLKKKQQYQGALRATLDFEALPTPLRLFAYLSDDWRLSSKWRVWQL